MRASWRSADGAARCGGVIRGGSNRRSVHVLNRMNEAAAAMDGRSLTYRELTGSRG